MKKIIVAVGASLLLFAGYLWPYEDALTSLSYISYVERYATVQPAMSSNSVEASINLPLVPGDRIDTAREAKLEIRLSDGSTVWLDQYTSLSLDAIAFSRGTSDERTVLYLGEGRLFVEIPEEALVSKPTRLDTPAATAYLEKPGLYAAQARDDGSLYVEVWDGMVQVSTPRGIETVEAGEAALVASGQVLERSQLPRKVDEFFAFVLARREEAQDQGDLHLDTMYESEEAVLDAYGTWYWNDELDTWVWKPDVSVDWSPYVYGRWYWTPAGWTWVSFEVWGWVPYHYGTWFWDPALGWVWVWDSIWGPAWVYWVWWPGWVGWCPAGYYDYWYWYWYWRDYWYDPGYRHPPYYSPPHRETDPGDVGSRPGRGTPPLPSRYTAELSGDVELVKMDPRGWRVVRSSDLASPALPSISKPMAEVEGELRGLKGVVYSGPLLTDPPEGKPISKLVDSRFASIRGEKDLTQLFSDPSKLGSGVRDAVPQPVVKSKVAEKTLSLQVAPAPRKNSTVSRPDTLKNPHLFREPSQVRTIRPLAKQNSNLSSGRTISTGSPGSEDRHVRRSSPSTFRSPSRVNRSTQGPSHYGRTTGNTPVIRGSSGRLNSSPSLRSGFSRGSIKPRGSTKSFRSASPKISTRKSLRLSPRSSSSPKLTIHRSSPRLGSSFSFSPRSGSSSLKSVGSGRR